MKDSIAARQKALSVQYATEIPADIQTFAGPMRKGRAAT